MAVSDAQTPAKTPAMATETTVDSESLVGLLNQLVEVPAPPPVSMMPQTAGWAVVAGALLVVALIGLWRQWRHYRARAYRRAALRAVAAAQDVAELSGILKRTAMVSYGRKEVAALTGQPWVAFLTRTGGGAVFANAQGAALVAGAYVAQPAAVEADLRAAAAAWIKSHQAEDGARQSRKADAHV